MKILITEQQYILIKESDNSDIILSFRDLSQMVGRMGYTKEDEEVFFNLFRLAYLRDGDDGVVELFKHATNIKIEPIRKGRYIISYR